MFIKMRVILFLLLVAPIHYAICFVILVLGTFFLKPNFLIQIFILLPTSSLAIAMLYPILLGQFVIPKMYQITEFTKRCSIGAAILNIVVLCSIFTFIWLGYTTPLEALIVGAILLISGSIVLLKLLWQRPVNV